MFFFRIIIDIMTGALPTVGVAPSPAIIRAAGGCKTSANARAGLISSIPFRDWPSARDAHAPSPLDKLRRVVGARETAQFSQQRQGAALGKVAVIVRTSVLGNPLPPTAPTIRPPLFPLGICTAASAPTGCCPRTRRCSVLKLNNAEARGTIRDEHPF
jgi:hypothetical protein